MCLFQLLQLSNLVLADNLMGKVPFVPISHISTLKKLDLSKNRIEKLEDSYFASGAVRLDQLFLIENPLEKLEAKSFSNFQFINFTSLAGSPIRTIESDAFKDAQIKMLDLSNCLIESVEEKAFNGLEKTLEHLDLSANRLRSLPEDIFEDFDFVKNLRLNDNMLSFSPNLTFNGFRYTISDLDLLGTDMSYVPLEEIGIMRNLRTVGISAVSGLKSKSKEFGPVERPTFADFAPGLEELNLVNAGINKIDKNAFAHVPSISSMDLSDNRIGSIDPDGFREVGHSLQHLKISNALYFTELPNRAFHSLTALCTLDLSDNHIRTVPLDTFHKMPKLLHLYLQDNEISTFKRGTFHSQANPNLRILDLSFNKIEKIPYDTFRFTNLIHLLLDDNRIKELDARSFVEMKSLQYLSLEGNRLQKIPDEAFQNLHHLRKLNLAHNELKSLNFAAFDKVGTLVHMQIDASHNKLQFLRANRTLSYPTSSNIMSLNLASNNVSMIEMGFFDPVQNVMKVLNLSHNSLLTITPENIGSLRRLHSLDLSHNILETIEQGTFVGTKKLHSIFLNNNNLSSLDQSMFTNKHKLRIIDLSNNRLKVLPETLFMRTSLEIFGAANNLLKEIPIKALNPVQSTLKHLNLAGNKITTISYSQLNQIQSLVLLNLANNKITTIDDKAFCCLPNLSILDLSGNPLQRIKPNTFDGIRTHLQSLNIADTSQNQLPNLQLSQLKELNVSHNELTFVPPNTLANLSEVRVLDLSHNSLTSPPSNAWHSMLQLNTLKLSGNPISVITNDSFLGLDKLEHLDIANINGSTYQVI